MRSVKGGGIQTGGSLSFLMEVSPDLVDLRGVGDHGDEVGFFRIDGHGIGHPVEEESPSSPAKHKQPAWFLIEEAA